MDFMAKKGATGVLFPERVSVFKGALKSDSIEAQHGTLLARLQAEQADGRTIVHVGTAVDKGVSGYKIDIFDREGPGACCRRTNWACGSPSWTAPCGAPDGS